MMTPTLILENCEELRVQSLFDHHEPGGDHRAVPSNEPIPRQSAANAPRVSGLSGSSGAQRWRRTGDGNDALGNAATATGWWIPGHEHQEHVVAALAGLAQAREPLSGPGEQLAEYETQPNPETKKKEVVWFALNEDRPLFAFAGIWTEFNGDRAPSRNPFQARISSMAS
jgi:hypothetical protein